MKYQNSLLVRRHDAHQRGVPSTARQKIRQKEEKARQTFPLSLPLCLEAEDDDDDIPTGRRPPLHQEIHQQDEKECRHEKGKTSIFLFTTEI